MSGHADTIRRVEEWMEQSRAEGFEYCCETAEENGLTYEVLAALLAELRQQADRIAWLEGEVARRRIENQWLRDALANAGLERLLAECEEWHEARGD